MANDMRLKLSEFKDEKKGSRLLAQQMGIHLKTFRRILAQENTPGYLTLYKIYRILLSTNNDSEILKMVHPSVAAQIKKLNTKKLSQEFNYTTDVEELLSADPVALEIYFLQRLRRSLVRWLFIGLEPMEKRS